MAEQERSTTEVHDAAVEDTAGTALGALAGLLPALSAKALAADAAAGLDPAARRAALAGICRGRGNRFAQSLAREIAARPRVARSPTPSAPPVEHAYAGAEVYELVVSLARGRIGFMTSLGTILGTVDTDLGPGSYVLRPEPDQRSWTVVTPAVIANSRFEVTLDGADPWTFRYPGDIALRVVEGLATEPATFGEAMGPAGPKDPLWFYEGSPPMPGPVKGVDDLASVVYDQSYRWQPGGGMSKWLQVHYRDGTTQDVHIDEIDESTPNLWEAKREVLQFMDDDFTVFALDVFSTTVFFLLTLAPQPTSVGGRRYVVTQRDARDFGPEPGPTPAPKSESTPPPTAMPEPAPARLPAPAPRDPDRIPAPAPEPDVPAPTPTPTRSRDIRRTPEIVDKELVAIGPKGPKTKEAPPPGTDPYQNYVAARDAAERSSGLGTERVPTMAKTMGPATEHLAGRQMGWQSADGSRGWRVDFDPKSAKRMHVNWWRIEDDVLYQGSIRVWGGDERVFLDVLRRHFAPGSGSL